jgi:transcription termination factor Rho
MTDTPEVTPVRSSSPELSAMTLPKLKEVATQLGIDGAAKLKKDALVTAIADLQAANREAAKAEREARREARNAKKRGNKDNSNNSNANSDDDGDDEGDDNSSSSSNDSNSNSNRPNRDRHDRGRDRGRDRNRDRQGRDRGNREEREIVISEDDVLLPVGGIADIMESYAFIRTGGYLPSPNDVYISLQQVRRFGLRKGDVVTGAVRQPQEGERREKFNALVRLDTINGVTHDEARNRVEF